MKAPLIIGICGRSCSGKGDLTDKIASVNKNILLLGMDIFFKKRTCCNYQGYSCIEHTDSIRFDHLIETVKAVKKGESHVIHSETPWLSQDDIEISSKDLKAKDLVIVEGFLLFAEKQLADLFDIRIFIDVSDLNMLYRRLLRQNMSGINYIYDVIIPVSKEYEQMQKNNADIIFGGNKPKEEVINDVCTYINEELARRKVNFSLGLPPNQQPWKIFLGNLLTDHAWHPIDYDNLKNWVRDRKTELDDGEELTGNTFRYRHNLNTRNYEVRLSHKYNMYRYELS